MIIEMKDVVMDSLGNLPEGFKAEDGSLYAVDKEGEWVKVTNQTFIFVTAHVRSPDQSGWGKSCIVIDLKGKEHSFVIQNADLMGGGKSAIRTIVNHGLTVMPGCEKYVVSYLLLSTPEDMNIRVTSGGWADTEDPVFVLPSQINGNMDHGEKVVYEPEVNSKTAQSVTSRGTLAQWKTSVAELARNNHLIVFGILAALAGCLFRLLGISGAGWNIHGHSSRGKTTFLCVASSTWGNGIDPALDSVNSFARRWNTTGNALEAIAAAHCDTAICLDELGGYPGNSLDQDIYLITGGQGKTSLTSSRAMRFTRTWRGNCLSTGEKSFKTAIQQSGKHFMAGQMLRMVDIHVEDVLPNPPDGMSPAEFAVQLKTAAATYYGTAGPAIVTGIIDELNEDRENTLQVLKENLDLYTQELTPEGASPEQGRVFQRMAAIITVGELGIEKDVLPYSLEEVKESVFFVRDLWLAENSTIADTDRSLVDLQQYLIRNHASFPSSTDKQAKGGNVRAFWSSNMNAFLLTDDQFRTAINSGGEKEVLSKLRKLNLLVVNEPGRQKVKAKIASAGDRWIRFYAIKAAIMELDLDGTKDQQAPVEVSPLDELEKNAEPLEDEI